MPPAIGCRSTVIAYILPDALRADGDGGAGCASGHGPATIPMASISRADVEHVADLARLHLTDEEIDRMQTQLSNILEAIETLRDVDTSHVGPTASVIQLENVMRDDTRRRADGARRRPGQRAAAGRPVPARPDRAGGGPMSEPLLADRTITASPPLCAAVRRARES